MRLHTIARGGVMVINIYTHADVCMYVHFRRDVACLEVDVVKTRDNSLMRKL